MKKDIIYGFITVRTSSTRLPNKCLLPLGNESVIEHVIKRCLTYSIEPIVAKKGKIALETIIILHWPFDSDKFVIQKPDFKSSDKYR